MSEHNESTQAVGPRLDCHVRALLACPFCGGPPKPIATRGIHGGTFKASELDEPEGLYVRALVFCHECGADGEAVTEICYSPQDVDSALGRACDLWNRRDQRNADLFTANAEAGGNTWPRPNVRAERPQTAAPQPE